MLTKLRILGLDYEVEFSAMRITNGNTNYGTVALDLCKLSIDNGTNSPGMVRATLLHEILEVLVYRLDIDIKHSDICAIESGLIAVLRDNKELAQYLTEEDDDA